MSVFEQPAVVAAIVALVTTLLATPLRYLIERALLRNKLQEEYEYEQRKELNKLVGHFHGRLLDAANSFHHRMMNLYANEGKGWLDLKGSYKGKDGPYYFNSMVYRFLALVSLSIEFERQAFYLDARIAEPRVFSFLNFVQAFRWAMTDADLFPPDYDPHFARDHFFADELRAIAGDVAKQRDFDLRTLERWLDRPHRLESVLKFFDGLRRGEQRYRWDRLVALDLLLMAFINVFGYKPQYTAQDWFEKVAAKIEHDAIPRNLDRWLPKLGLTEEKEVKKIQKAIRGRSGGGRG